MNQFVPTPRNQQGLRIVQFLPTGKAWDAATDTDRNMGKFFRGLGVEFYRLELLLQTLNREGDINQTVQLIREWETAVGIPDDCFGISADIATRRKQVLIKLRNIRIQTVQDYIDLAAEFGTTIQVFPGVPTGFGGTTKEKKFSITIDLPSDAGGQVFPFNDKFPIPFTSQINSSLQCLFDKVKPANVRIVYRFGFNSILDPVVQAAATVSVDLAGVLFDDAVGDFDDASGDFDDM